MSELINNRATRIESLKRIILQLHQGTPADEVRARLTEIVRETDAVEIAAMEQQLMAEGMAVEEVRAMCDLHAEVLRDVTRPLQVRPRLLPGHPAETLQRENQAIAGLVSNVRAQMVALAEASPGADMSGALDACRQLANQLFDLFKHYDRKELLLFPCLERHGITGPSKVMWAKDDEVRALVKDLAGALTVEDATADEWRLVAETVAEAALRAVEAMIDKEERILIPMALDTLTRDEWAEIWRESPRIGWCLVEPGTEFVPALQARPEHVVDVPAGRSMVFPTGHLTFEQLRGLFSALPVDLTFVGADDRVAFFTEGADRVFARSRTAIGRLVQHCHPPRSVAVVERILDDFRSGRQNVAEFWISFQGRFVHIRYFAVRDEAGTYLGCLEVTQDATRIRALEGERRLLQYDTTEPVMTKGGHA